MSFSLFKDGLLTDRAECSSAAHDESPVNGINRAVSQSTIFHVDGDGSEPVSSTFEWLTCPAGRDGGQHLHEDLPTNVKDDLSLSSVVIDPRANASLRSAYLVREGHQLSSGDTTANDGSNLTRFAALDDSNEGTVRRILSSWVLGSEPQSWRWTQSSHGSVAPQAFIDRSSRQLPITQTSSAIAPPSQRQLQAQEISKAAIPSVLSVSAPSPVQVDYQSQPSIPGIAGVASFPSPSLPQSQVETSGSWPRPQAKKKVGQKRRPGGF